MAKGKSSKSGTRDPSESLTQRLRSPVIKQRHLSPLTLIQDLRTFDFEPDTRPARLFSGSSAGITVSTPSQKQGRSRVPYQIAFSAPAETLVCVRRHRRKEVLFAKKKAGKSGQRKPRRSKWSSTKC